jgi:hypothetical protein
VVAFGRSDACYMERAEANTGLKAINIQDRINIRRGLGSHFPSSFEMENLFLAPERGRGGLHPMFSGVMTQEALGGKAAGTVHFDMRGVSLTPALPPESTPGFSAGDFHSSSEARQGIAHLASTGPGERSVTIVIQHEEGVTTIGRESNTVQGARLPKRLADFIPNINNNPTTHPPPPGPKSSIVLDPAPSARGTALALVATVGPRLVEAGLKKMGASNTVSKTGGFLTAVGGGAVLGAAAGAPAGGVGAVPGAIIGGTIAGVGYAWDIIFAPIDIGAWKQYKAREAEVRSIVGQNREAIEGAWNRYND